MVKKDSNSDMDLFSYCVGLLEGEGSFQARIKKPNNVSIYLQVSMCDKEPLEKLIECFGGGICGPYFYPNPKWRSYCVWTMGRRHEVIPAIVKMYPLMSLRRQTQIDRMLELDIMRPTNPSIKFKIKEPKYVHQSK